MVFHNKGDKSHSITDQTQFITYIKMPIMMHIDVNWCNGFMIICKSYVNDKFTWLPTEAHISYRMGYANTAYIMLFHIFLKDLLL